MANQIITLDYDLNICIDMNSRVAESPACMACLTETVKEGLGAAFILLEYAVRTQDAAAFAETFNKTKKLFPKTDNISLEIKRNLNMQKSAFDRKVSNLIAKYPSFLIKYLIPAVNNNCQKKGK